MITRVHIQQLFSLLEAGGCRRPRTLDSNEFLEAAAILWSVVLADLEPYEMVAAAMAFLRGPDSSWWPTPGRILTLVPGRAADEIDDAPEAWAFVMKALQDRGRDHPPPEDWSPFKNADRDDALRWALRAIGSWRDLCVQETSVLETSIRASFRDAYRAARQRKRLARQEADAQRLLETLRDRGLPPLLRGELVDSPPRGGA